MACKIEFETNGSAFRDVYKYHNDGAGDDKRQALDAIRDCLRQVANRLDCGESSGRVVDPNGNTVGTFHCTDI